MLVISFRFSGNECRIFLKEPINFDKTKIMHLRESWIFVVSALVFLYHTWILRILTPDEKQHSFEKCAVTTDRKKALMRSAMTENMTNLPTNALLCWKSNPQKRTVSKAAHLLQKKWRLFRFKTKIGVEPKFPQQSPRWSAHLIQLTQMKFRENMISTICHVQFMTNSQTARTISHENMLEMDIMKIPHNALVTNVLGISYLVIQCTNMFDMSHPFRRWGMHSKISQSFREHYLEP